MTEQGSQDEEVKKQIRKKAPKPEKPPKPEKQPKAEKAQNIEPQQQSKPGKKKVAKICNVCFQIAGTPIPDPGYDLIHCETCDLTTHRRCIGEDIPFNEIRPVKGAPIKFFECVRCQVESKALSNKLKCVVCHQGNGLMTKIEERRFAHIVCALMSDHFEIEDFGLMKFKQIVPQIEIDMILKAQQAAKPRSCLFCKSQEGFLLKCLKRNCKLRAHAFCLQSDRKAQLEMKHVHLVEGQEHAVEDEGVGWEVEFRIQDYTSQPNYSLEQDLYSTIRNQAFFQHDLTIKTFACEAELDSTSTTADSKYRRTKSTSTLIKDAKHSETLSKGGNKLHSKVNLPMRGGKVSLVCHDHRNQLKICTCTNIKCLSNKLVQCDFCRMWFHCSCVGISKREANEADFWSCQKCTRWGQFRCSVILPSLSSVDEAERHGMLVPRSYKGGTNLYTEKVWRGEILPNERYRLKLLDSLIIGKIWSLQARQLADHSYATTGELLKQQLIRAHYIPLNLNSIVTSINEKIEKVAAFEHTIEDTVFGKFSINDVKLVITEEGNRIEENIEYNKRVSKRLKEVIEQEITGYQVKSSRCEDLEFLYRLCDAVVDLIEVVTIPTRKIALSTLETYRKLFFIAKDTQHYKNHLKPQMMQFIKEGQDFQLVLKEATSYVCPKEPDQLNFSEIAKGCLNKKHVDWVLKHVIEASSKSKIDNSTQIEKIKADVDKAQAWELRNGSIEEWMRSLREIASLVFKTDKTDKAVQMIRDNEKWIDDTLSLLTSAKSKTNQYETLEQRITDLSSKYQSVELAQSCLKALKTIQSKVTAIQKAYNTSISKDELAELVERAKALTVRPSAKFYKNLKFHLLVFKWLNGEKIVVLEEIESWLKTFDGPIKSSCNEKVSKGQQFIQDNISSLLKRIAKEVANYEEAVEVIGEVKKQVDTMSKDLQIKSSSVPDFTSLKQWFDKIDVQLSKHTAKIYGKPIREQCEIIRKDEIPKLLAAWDKNFATLCEVSKVYHSAFLEIRDSYCDPLTASFLGKGKISLKKLNKLKGKLAQQKDATQKLSDVQKVIDSVTAWYADFKQSLPPFQSDLRRELKSNPKKVLDNATRLCENQKKMRLEIDTADQKQLTKCRSWSKLTIDCNQLAKGKKDVKMTLDRMYEIRHDVRKILCLDNDIESIKFVRSEFVKVDKWHEDLDKVMSFNQARTMLKADRDMLRNLIKEARQTINVNIDDEINELDRQLGLNDDWEDRCVALLNSTDYHKADEARDLIQRIKNDKEQNYTLIDTTNIQKIRLWYIKAICNRPSERENGHHLSVKEFLKIVETDMAMIQENRDDFSLQDDIKIIELAYRLIQRIMPPQKRKPGQVLDDKPLEKKLLTMEDCELILESVNLPFKVDDKLFGALKSDRDLYFSVLEKEAKELIATKPRIEQVEGIMKKLERMSFISPMERKIDRSRKDYYFLLDCLILYPVPKPKTLQTPVKDEKSTPDPTDQFQDNLRLNSEFLMMTKKYNKLLIQCPQAERLVKELQTARETFDALKEEFNGLKISNSFTFANLGSINDRLMLLTIDFEDEELQFRQEIWHSRIAHLLLEIERCKAKNPKVKVKAETVRHWLEEGQELEVVKDRKYEQLSEVVEDIDFIVRATRMCSTTDEVDLIETQESSGLIDITLIIYQARQRLAQLAIKMENKPPKQYKLLAKGILEYLACLRDEAANDKDAEMREDDDSMDESDDELGSESDDLVDERNDNEIVPEVERPARAKPGFRKPYVKKRLAKGSSQIRPKLKGSKPSHRSESKGDKIEKREKRERRQPAKEESSEDEEAAKKKLQALKDRIAMKNGGFMNKVQELAKAAATAAPPVVTSPPPPAPPKEEEPKKGKEAKKVKAPKEKKEKPQKKEKPPQHKEKTQKKKTEQAEENEDATSKEKTAKKGIAKQVKKADSKQKKQSEDKSPETDSKPNEEAEAKDESCEKEIEKPAKEEKKQSLLLLKKKPEGEARKPIVLKKPVIVVNPSSTKPDIPKKRVNDADTADCSDKDMAPQRDEDNEDEDREPTKDSDCEDKPKSSLLMKRPFQKSTLSKEDDDDKAKPAIVGKKPGGGLAAALKKIKP